jgi:predicted ArsR family transcriptional regulator
MGYDTDEKIRNVKESLDERRERGDRELAENIANIQGTVGEIRKLTISMQDVRPMMARLEATIETHLPYLARKDDITQAISTHEHNCPFAAAAEGSRAQIIRLSAVIASVAAAIGGFIVFVIEKYLNR